MIFMRFFKRRKEREKNDDDPFGIQSDDRVHAGFPQVVPKCFVSPHRIRTVAFHGVPHDAGGMSVWERYSHALAQRIFPSFWKNSVVAGHLV